MRVFLGNIPFDIDELGLRDEIDGLGLKPTELAFIVNRDTGKGRGFCFLDFKTDAEAHAAIELLNRSFIDGRDLRANVAQEREQRSFGAPRGPKGGSGGPGGHGPGGPRPPSFGERGRAFGGGAGGGGGGGGGGKKRGHKGSGRRRDVADSDFGWGKNR